jgi:multidrug resistance protein
MAGERDIEKQASVSEPMPPTPYDDAREYSSADENMEELHEQTSDDTQPSHHREKPARQTTKFATPNYQAADGVSAAPTAQRTFSRRTQRSEDDHSHHFFGGDLSHSRAEMALERFLSQKPKLENGEPIIVHWEGEDDPENPQNWSFWYRCWLTAFAALLVLNSTFTSSAPNGITREMEAYFGFSQEVATLTISLWVAGYCLGPLIWGPMSERIGRRPVFLLSIFMYTIWNVACALSKNTAQILVFRFLGGVFGAAPLTNSGGVIADIWDARRRGVAMGFFAVAPFAGPAVGPIVSGAVAVSGVTWRWVYWACAMFSGVCLIFVAFTMKETYAPIILTRKAQRICKETGQDVYKSPLQMNPLVPKHLLHDTLLFPFVMLVQEPILLALGLYLSFVYGIIYLLFGAYPIIFEQIHGFNPLIGGLMFIPLFLGGVAGVIIYVLVFNPRYVKKADQCARQGKGRVPPEERLWIVCVAAPCLVISFFWIGWTHYASISFWSPMMGGALLGFAILMIFLGLFNYIVDAYLAKAASGLAGNTVMRSAFGAGFPLFTSQMFARLGVQWACTLLGCLSLIMLPIPFILVRYGAKVRQLSKHAT